MAHPTKKYKWLPQNIEGGEWKMEPLDSRDRSVGIDMGGSWIRAALGDRNGKIIRRAVAPMDAGDADAFIKQLDALIRRVAGDSLGEVTGIGIGAAGRLDLKRGAIMFSPHTCLRDFGIASELESRTGKEVRLLNDCATAVLAEHLIGAGRGCDNLVYVGIGTGIGGGIIVDGRLILGKDGNAHEIGHMIIDIDGRIACECGGLGHWEAYTSGSGLPKLARHLAEGYAEESPFLDCVRKCRPNAKEIFDAAAGKDRFAVHVLDVASEINSKAFANLVDLYDPELITIGGGLAMKNRDLVMPPISERLPAYSFNRAPRVIPTPLGEDAPLLGAILAAYGPAGTHGV